MRSLVTGLVTTAFGIVGDLRDTVTYRRKVPTTYDPATDTTTNPTVTTTFLGVLSRFRSSETNVDVITLSDAKLLFPANLISFEPSINDEIVVHGKTWNVHRVLSVPGDSLYKLQIREK